MLRWAEVLTAGTASRALTVSVCPAATAIIRGVALLCVKGGMEGWVIE